MIYSIRLFLVLHLMALSKIVLSQQIITDTLFYADGIKVSTPDSASVFKILLHYDSLQQKVYERIFTIEGEPVEETHYSDFGKGVVDLYHREFYNNRKTYKYVGYNKGKLEGKFQLYYPTGIKKREDIYEKDKWVKGFCYDSAGNEIRYIPYQSDISFLQGDIELQERIQLELSKTLDGAGTKYGYKNFGDAAISGRVIVRFTIDKNGVMRNVRVLQSPDASINDRVINAVIKIRGWNPATVDGDYVDSEKTIAISVFMN